jgi:predicted dehydrogenase
MRKIKLAIDGCGSLAVDTVLPHLMQDDARERCEVVAVCDVQSDRRRMARDRFESSAKPPAAADVPTVRA